MNTYRPGRDHTSRTFPVVPPIYQTTTFELDDTSYADIQGTGGLHETWYSRFGNPTVDAAAAEVARLHGAARSLMTASGMAAVATTLVTLLRSGDTVVASKQVYGDTDDLLTRDLPALGITVIRVDAFDTDGWERAVAEHRPTVLYGETLSNPQLRLMNIPAVADIAHAAGARLVVDNTFATPFCTRPLALGADVVVESATKFLAGHSDVVAGAVTVDDEALAEEVQRRLITFGGCLDPHAAFLAWRGMRTFGVRLAEACRSAEIIATKLAEEPDIEHVRHPSRLDHPDAGAVVDAVMPGARGAMLSLVFAGGDERVLRVLRRLRVAVEATSLGGVETLASVPFNSSHFNMTPQQRADAGIPPGMLRLSVGLEGADELIADLRQAIAATS
ncbi:trans-sulfuration enzyme family protein [Virgisporangium aurantiacum]|uniref:homocysteine desulfhydrase n=1 Tax=Virgisporangium aurantiacum TaxID=175570 RepID=A0A8J3Z5B3_9ACTN|nr:PLP-dependent aspartate aminotransferase family protein [Virgisporangium aurantiacum]GIJ55521.1 methionine gamma-lyase [Virgisporangium aurantiacum]